MLVASSPTAQKYAPLYQPDEVTRLRLGGRGPAQRTDISELRNVGKNNSSSTSIKGKHPCGCQAKSIAKWALGDTSAAAPK